MKPCQSKAFLFLLSIFAYVPTPPCLYNKCLFFGGGGDKSRWLFPPHNAPPKTDNLPLVNDALQSPTSPIGTTSEQSITAPTTTPPSLTQSHIMTKFPTNRLTTGRFFTLFGFCNYWRCRRGVEFGVDAGKIQRGDLWRRQRG